MAKPSDVTPPQTRREYEARWPTGARREAINLAAALDLLAASVTGDTARVYTRQVRADGTATAWAQVIR
jgi:hypothetical protein